jgi:hypothetical protein
VHRDENGTTADRPHLVIRRVVHGDANDVGAVFARRPDVVVVDEDAMRAVGGRWDGDCLKDFRFGVDVVAVRVDLEDLIVELRRGPDGGGSSIVPA